MMATALRILDDIVYYTCCLIVILHSLAALIVITRGRCSIYAATFLVACAMWLDLTALNLWFFLPAIIQEASSINFHINPAIGFGWYDALAAARDVLLSNSMSFIFMMLFGWFVGSMSLSNALSMWQREGCNAMGPHTHTGLAGRAVRLAHTVEEYVGIYDAGNLPFLHEDTVRERRRVRQSCLFAIPRALHRFYLLLLSPPATSLDSHGGKIAEYEKSWQEGDMRGIGMHFDEKIHIEEDCGCVKNLGEVKNLENEKGS